MWGDLQVPVRIEPCKAHAGVCSCSVRKCCRVADWHAQLNNKMGGDMKKIQTVGQYFVEVWKSVGMEGINDKVRSATASKNAGALPGE